MSLSLELDIFHKATGHRTSVFFYFLVELFQFLVFLEKKKTHKTYISAKQNEVNVSILSMNILVTGHLRLTERPRIRVMSRKRL